MIAAQRLRVSTPSCLQTLTTIAFTCARDTGELLSPTFGICLPAQENFCHLSQQLICTRELLPPIPAIDMKKSPWESKYTSGADGAVRRGSHRKAVTNHK